MAPKGQKGLSFTEQKSKGVSKPSISKQSTASSHQSSNKPPSGAQAQKNQASPAKPPSKPGGCAYLSCLLHVVGVWHQTHVLSC